MVRYIFKEIQAKLSVQIYGGYENKDKLPKETLPDYRSYQGIDNSLIENITYFKNLNRFPK